MGADAFHVFFGLRRIVRSEQELNELEERADSRLLAARKARLHTCLTRPTDGEPHVLLIGHHLGTFGVQHATSLAMSEKDIEAIVEETKRRLQQAAFDSAEAMFHFQLEAQY